MFTGCDPWTPSSWTLQDIATVRDGVKKYNAEQAAATDPQQAPIHLNPTLICIRHVESDRGAWPYDTGYQAQNRYSSASGAYQYVDGTWASQSTAAGYGRMYAKAKYAPVAVQDAVAYYTITHGGTGPWAPDGC
jgi:hypothetical protein